MSPDQPKNIHNMPVTNQKIFTRSRRLMCTSALLLCLSSQAMAGPEGGVTIGGSASIDVAGPNTTIRQSSDRALIRWDSFDVQGHESVDFQQPSTSSITVNRIRDTKASQIDGRITANGNIMLLNPNGVIFGSGSRVDVGGLAASSSDIEDDTAFLAGGQIKLTQPGGADSKIENRGVIRIAPGGLAGFVSPQVENSGIIEAFLGKITTASGDMATVDFAGDGLIQVAVSDTVRNQLVKNTGILSADGGTVTMTAAAARDVVGSLIEVSGYVGARSVDDKQGNIQITADKTKGEGASTVIIKDAVLDASGRNKGERGGDVTVTADNVALLSGTVIDASGYEGLSNTTKDKKISDARVGAAGGDIKIGGDHLGQGKTHTAKNLYVNKDVSVLNDSLHEGDAGRTIFWSDDTTQFYGNVYARALGHSGGDGGFVETSGKNTLVSDGNVDANSANGVGGTWLLDPSDVTIASGAGADVNVTPVGGTWTPTVGASTSTIFVNNINTALTGGTSVVINTSSSGGGSGDITLGAGANISTGTTASLTFNATRNITLTGNISLGTGALTLNATGGNISGAGNIASSGSRVFNVGSGSGTYSGVVSGTGSLTKQGSGTLTLTSANTYTGNTNVSAGMLSVSGQPYFNVGRTTNIASGATMQLLNSNNNFFSQMPFSTITGAGTLQFAGNSGLSQSSGGIPGQGRFILSMGAGGLLDLQGTSTITNGGWQNINWTGNSGSLNIGSGSNLEIGDGNAVRIDALTGSGSITKTFGAAAVGITLGVNGGSGNFSGVISNTSSTITVTKNGAGTQTFSGNNTYGGTTTVSAGTLQIGNGGATGTLGTANVANSGTLSFNRSDAITLANTISGSGALTQSGTGTTILTANNTYAGTTTISAGALQIGNNGTTGTLGGGAVINNASLIYDRSDAVTLNNAISGTGSFTKLRANILTLGAGKTYGGATTVSGGTLRASSTSSFSANSSTTVASGATLDVAGWTNSVGSLAGAGTVTNSNAATTTLTAGGNNTSTTFSGVLQNGTGLIALTKAGSGTMTLSGTNTNSGATAISAGTLQVLNTSTSAAVGVLGGGAVSVASGAQLRFTNSRILNDGYQIANAISGAGSLLFDGPDGAITTLSGAKTYSGGTTISSGVVNLDNNAGFGSGTVTMTGGAVRATLSSRTLANAFNLNGTIGLGSMTNITGGITLNGNSRITCSSNCGSSTFSGLVALGGNTLSLSDTGPNRLGATWAGQALTISNVISGTGSVTQASAGTLTLSGANTYTGVTRVNAGTLTLGASNRLADASAVSVNSGGTFNLSGFTDTIASLTSVAGSTVALGNGGITTSGAQSYGGVVTGGNVNLTSTGGGAITANNVTNDFIGTVNINTTGVVSIVDANTLTLGTITGSTIFAQTIGAAADLTLGGNLTASATSGDSIILAAGRDLDNTGNRLLNTAGTARWQIYSGDLANDTQSLGGLTGYTLNGCTYSIGGPVCAGGTTIPASGNGFYYAFGAVPVSVPVMTIQNSLIPRTVEQAISGNNQNYNSFGYSAAVDASSQNDNAYQDIVVVPDDKVDDTLNGGEGFLIIMTQNLKKFFRAS